jgi:hypothetical protein
MMKAMREAPKLSNYKLLIVMIDLFRWELNKLPFLGTLTGRELYYHIVESAIAAESNDELLIKQLTRQFSERALRLRIRDFEQLGLIEMCGCSCDARARKLMPTGKLLSLLSQHHEQLRLLIGRHHYMLNK